MGTQVLERVGLNPAENAILSGEQRNLLSRLEDFEAPYLEEKLLEKGVFSSSEQYQRTFTEFKKYVALSRMVNEPLEMVSPKVDELWHQFILFTRQYASFCENVVGRFLHHSPHTSKTLENVRESGAKNFIGLYQQIFGDLPKIWAYDRGSTCGVCSDNGCSNGL